MTKTMTVHSNDFASQWREIRELALKAVDRVGNSGYLILGKELDAFEASLAKLWGLKYAVGCGNGLDAIEISLRVLGIQPGDPVLTTPLSAFATSLAIIRAGGKPTFIDTDASGNVNLDLAFSLLEKRRDIRFFVPVHLFGNPLDLRKLEMLRNTFDLKIVEDCAQAIGAKYDTKAVGSVGQLAATSFYPTKNLGALGDAGAILCNENEKAKLAKSLRDYGQCERYKHNNLGLNSRLDEIHASILNEALLPRLPAHSARRKEIAAQYLSRIDNKKIKKLAINPQAEPVWHLFPVFVAKNRDSFQAHLQGNGISTGSHYPILIPDQEVFQKHPHLAAETASGLAISRGLCASEISLPIHPYLKEEQIDHVIAVCNAWSGN